MNFVEDTVRGFVAAVVADDKHLGEVFNIGSGQEIAIGDLVGMIVEATGSQADIESVAERTRPEKSEVDRLLADSAKARHCLGWEPQVTLRGGLERTIDWFRQDGRLERYREELYNV
jgi:nucleoside-diphosphate-sugar epimerase